jgi:hypothetical protein
VDADLWEAKDALPNEVHAPTRSALVTLLEEVGVDISSTGPHAAVLQLTVKGVVDTILKSKCARVDASALATVETWRQAESAWPANLVALVQQNVSKEAVRNAEVTAASAFAAITDASVEIDTPTSTAWPRGTIAVVAVAAVVTVMIVWQRGRVTVLRS